MTVLNGTRVVLRPAVDSDVDGLVAILSDDAVEPWWPGPWNAESPWPRCSP